MTTCPSSSTSQFSYRSLWTWRSRRYSLRAPAMTSSGLTRPGWSGLPPLSLHDHLINEDEGAGARAGLFLQTAPWSSARSLPPRPSASRLHSGLHECAQSPARSTDPGFAMGQKHVVQFMLVQEASVRLSQSCLDPLRVLAHVLVRHEIERPVAPPRWYWPSR